MRLLNQHPIETGCRRDAGGNILEANLLESLSLDFEGQRVFSALTANPPITFVVAVKQSGKVNARWREMKGTIGSISAGERAVAA